MPNDLINNDPLVSQNFFLEIDGEVITMLSGVSGLDVEVDVASIQQVGKNGMSQTVKTVASRNKAGDLSLTRMAPLDATADEIWKWFKTIRDGGLKVTDRAAGRKNGSVVVYDSTRTEVARFNFFNGWPSKIATDGLSADSNDPVKETITLVIERLERAK
ncbi:phage tail protein [Nakamurella silvestris]|nr:phage tail protein [Nakamurella silvestris]